MKIYQMLTADNFSDPATLEWVRLEAEYVMKILESDPNYALPGHMKQMMIPENLMCYFRRRERLERARCIFQYLLAFLGHIPSEEEVRGDLVDPAEQLALFWFDVHGNDIRRARRSDIFMFLLAHLVRRRCWRSS